jgi:general secretion pathway protein E/type IV pilus assembly protein PilB
MGVEPFLVASTVEAIMAQRLVSRLCSHCKEPFHPKADELPPDFPREKLPADAVLFRPVGCRQCRGAGYSGRMGIYELLVTTEALRELAHERSSTWEIKQAAVKQGMRTLRDDGWLKVIAGKTSLDEVLRITKGDRLVHMPKAAT